MRGKSTRKPITFGRKIQALRGFLVLTQLELSKLAGVSRNTLVAIENSAPPGEFFNTHDRITMYLIGAGAETLQRLTLLECVDAALTVHKT